MMKRLYIFALVILVFSLAEIGAQEVITTATNTQAQNYLVGPGDKIEGKILGEKQFDFSTYVDQTGNFYVPFDENPIFANCRTERDIRKEVVERISRYVRQPMVTVFVSERRKPIPVTVYGEVRKPQQVEITRETRLMELLAFSGGVNDKAGGVVTVFRPRPPKCAASKVQEEWEQESENGVEVPSRLYSISGIQRGENASNPRVYPGDLVVVDKASPVYINGQVVSRTGVYIKEGGLSLTQALAMVGGVREKAKVKDVRIYRRVPNSIDRKLISVNLIDIQKKRAKDIMLEPYDIVDVGTKKKGIKEIMLQALIGTGARTITQLGAGLPRTILY